MSKLAICFSGQGSQYVGMGLDFILHDEKSKRLVDLASKNLGENLVVKLNDEDALSQTKFVQPLIVLKSILGLELLDPKKYHIDGYFGFSLGEFSAYYASGIFSLDDILSIVKIRGELMQEASIKYPGSMSAILGLDYETIKDSIDGLKTKGIIEIANENGFKQYVISGESNLVDEANEILKTKGAKRAVKLNVSGAFHTKMMQEASQKFMNEIANFERKPLKTPMIMNIDAEWLNEHDVDHHLAYQMTSSVKFIDMVLKLKKDGFTHILEIGPGRVLTGLIKKIDLDMEVQNFDSFEQFQETKGWLQTHGFNK